MGSRGVWLRRVIATAAVIALYGNLAATIAVEKPESPPASASPKGGTPRSTVIFPALLADYYEHNREHTPPRDPRGVMQHRELSYHAPPDPFKILENCATKSMPDRQLASEMLSLRSEWFEGHEPDGPRLARLQKAAYRSTLQPESLMDAARGLQWLMGEQVASTMYSAGLQKALGEISAHHRDDARNIALLRELDQTRCLWQTSSFEALETRFRICRELYPPLSIESRRAGYLLAEAISNQGRLGEAADLILQVQQEHSAVGDLGQRETSDINEMKFVVGYLLVQAGRYTASIPNLSDIQGEHAKAARALLAEAYIQTKQFAAVQSLTAQTASAEQTDPRGPQPLSSRLREELDRVKWQEQMRMSGDSAK